MFREKSWIWNWRGRHGVNEPTETTLPRRAWAVLTGRYLFYPHYPSPFFEWAVAHGGGTIALVVLGVALALAGDTVGDIWRWAWR